MAHRWQAAYPSNVAWTAPLPPRRLDTLIDGAAERWPDKVGYHFYSRDITFAQMRDLAARVAKGLQALGVRPGTQVGLHLPNTPQYVACFFGVLKTGARVVNFSPLYAEREIRHQIEDSETDVLITFDFAPLFPQARRQLGTSRLKHIVVCSLGDALPPPVVQMMAVPTAPMQGDEIPFAKLIDNDGAHAPWTPGPLEDEIAVLQYTGGTTGVPKGAMLTHRNISAAMEQSRLWSQGVLEEGRERTLGVLPLFHVYGMTVVMLGSTDRGAELTLHLRFDPERVLKDIATRRITQMSGVPTMYMAMLQHPKLREFDLSSLKFCTSGGAPLPVDVLTRFQELTGLMMNEGYGLTETSPAATSLPLVGKRPPGSIGLPMPGTVIEVRDLETGERALPPGEKGEICIQGPQVMKGYWKRPAETEKALAGGFLHTGDVGIMTEEGFIYLVDRIKDLIISGGFNVYPRVVEEAIHEHPAVAEVIVIGIPDPYRGQAAKAFVKLAAGASLTFDELKAFLADRIGRHEIPAEMEIRAELPRTPVGKLSRKELVAEEEARRAKPA
jgi:long-chain acyl-CoA synthetase